jgi:hypothetical protein
MSSFPLGHGDFGTFPGLGNDLELVHQSLGAGQARNAALASSRLSATPPLGGARVMPRVGRRGGLVRAVIRLITPPFPAVSRPDACPRGFYPSLQMGKLDCFASSFGVPVVGVPFNGAACAAVSVSSAAGSADGAGADRIGRHLASCNLFRTAHGQIHSGR